MPLVLCWRQTGILSLPRAEDLSHVITAGQWCYIEKTISVIAYLGWISYVHYVLWHFSNQDSKWWDWSYHRDWSELCNVNKYRPYQCEDHRHSYILCLLLHIRDTFNQKQRYQVIYILNCWQLVYRGGKPHNHHIDNVLLWMIVNHWKICKPVKHIHILNNTWATWTTNWFLWPL